jgi:hypothetical protein
MNRPDRAEGHRLLDGARARHLRWRTGALLAGGVSPLRRHPAQPKRGGANPGHVSAVASRAEVLLARHLGPPSTTMTE